MLPCPGAVALAVVTAHLLLTLYTVPFMRGLTHWRDPQMLHSACTSPNCCHHLSPLLFRPSPFHEQQQVGCSTAKAVINVCAAPVTAEFTPHARPLGDSDEADSRSSSPRACGHGRRAQTRQRAGKAPGVRAVCCDYAAFCSLPHMVQYSACCCMPPLPLLLPPALPLSS
jgi:hypothetical protein